MRLFLLLSLLISNLFPGRESFCQTIQVSLGGQRSAEVYYEEKGQGRPVVILHRATSGYLEPIFEETDGWRRIYIDPPGIGKSSADDWVSNADDCLEIIYAAIQNILPHESFSLIGFSYFGYMARGIMALNPQRVDGMALICPVVVPQFEKRTLPASHELFIDSHFYENLDPGQKELLEPLVVRTPKSLEAVLRYKRNDVLLNAEFWNRVKQNGYSFSTSPDSLSFSKPSLILLGLQDQVVGYFDALALSGSMPRASIVVLDYAGHSLPFEQYVFLNLHLKEWLSRVK